MITEQNLGLAQLESLCRKLLPLVPHQWDCPISQCKTTQHAEMHLCNCRRSHIYDMMDILNHLSQR